MDDAKIRAIPSQETVAAAAELEIYDVNGKKLKFGSLFEDKKCVAVFVRHFFCSSCQDYVSRLAQIPKDTLERAGVQIVIIGSGQFQPIQFYHEKTSFTGPIFADPSTALFRTLGMTIFSTKRTPKGEPKRGYAVNAMPIWKSSITGIWAAITNAGLIGKQGHPGQLGGDFIFEPGNVCTFASRMRHSEDHVEESELLSAVGIEWSF